MSSTRARLKAANEALVAERFAEAATICELLLSEPGIAATVSYNANVFLGAAKEGLKRDEEALACYRQATGAQPEQILGWRALARYCETHHERQLKEDLPRVYDRLLELSDPNTDAKHADTLCKLVELLCPQGKHRRAVDTGRRWVDQYASSKARARVHMRLTDAMAGAPEGVFANEELFDQFEAVLALSPSDLPADRQQQPPHRQYWDILAQRSAPPERRLRAYAEAAASGAASAVALEATDRLAFARAELGVVRDGWRLGQLARHFAEANEAAAAAARPTEAVADWQSLAAQFYKKVVSCAHRRDWSDALAALDTVSQWAPSTGSAVVGCLPAVVRLLCAKGMRRHADCAVAAQLLRSGAKQRRPTAAVPRQELLDWCRRVCWRCLACYAEDQLLTAEELAAMQAEAAEDDSVAGSLAIALGRLGRLAEAEAVWPAERRHRDATGRRVSAFLAYQAKEWERARDLALGLVQDAEVGGGGGCSRPWDRLMLARCLWACGSAEAATQLRRCIEEDGYYADAYFWYGCYAEEVTGDAQLASQMFARAQALDGDHEAALRRLCDLLLREHREKECIQMLDQFAARFHRVVPWCYFILGVAHLNVADYHKAIDCLDRVVRLERDNPHAWTCLGEAYRLRGSYESAGKIFTHVVKRAPSDWYARLQLACVLHKQRLFLRAIEHLNLLLAEENCSDADRNSFRLLAQKQLSESHLQLGTDLASSGQHLSAAGHLALAASSAYAAIQIDRRPVCLWKLLGDALYRLGVYESAVIEGLPISEALRSLLAGLKGTGWQSRILSGCLEAYSSRMQQVLAGKAPPVDDAVARRVEADASMSDTSGRLESDAHFDLALVLLRVARCSFASAPMAANKCELQAVGHCEDALRLSPGRSDVWATLGVLWTHLNRHSHAQHCLIKSLQLPAEQSQAPVWAALGLFYCQLDKLQHGGACFRKAIDADPTLAVAWSGCGYIARAEEKLDQALDLWRHACGLMNPPLEAVQGFAYCTALLLTGQLQQQHQQPPKSSLPTSAQLYARLAAHAAEAAQPLAQEPWDRLALNNHLLLCLGRLGLRRAAGTAASLSLRDLRQLAAPGAAGAMTLGQRVMLSNCLRCLVATGEPRRLVEVADWAADALADPGLAADLSSQDLCYIGHCVAAATQNFKEAIGYFCEAVEQAARPELAASVWATAMASAEAIGDLDTAIEAMNNALKLGIGDAHVLRCVIAFASIHMPQMVSPGLQALRPLLLEPEADPQLGLAKAWEAASNGHYYDAMATALQLLHRNGGNSPAAWLAALRVSRLCCEGSDGSSLRSISAAAAVELCVRCLSRLTLPSGIDSPSNSYLEEVVALLPQMPVSWQLISALKRLCAVAPSGSPAFREVVDFMLAATS